MMLKGVGVMQVRLTKKESYVMLHAGKHSGNRGEVWNYR